MKSSSTGLEQTIRLHGEFTAPGLREPVLASNPVPFGSPHWHCFLPELNLALEIEPPEKELPALAQLADPEQSRLIMEKVLREAGCLSADQPITACTPKILSYKPGSRCTIRYELEYEASSVFAAGDVTIETSRQGNQVVLRIRDTGCGIPKEHLPRIFEPGFTTKGVGVGVGMGLAVVQQVIQEHHGTIDVESDAGKGCLVTIHLPLTVS